MQFVCLAICVHRSRADYVAPGSLYVNSSNGIGFVSFDTGSVPKPKMHSAARFCPRGSRFKTVHKFSVQVRAIDIEHIKSRKTTRLNSVIRSGTDVVKQSLQRYVFTLPVSAWNLAVCRQKDHLPARGIPAGFYNFFY